MLPVACKCTSPARSSLLLMQAAEAAEAQAWVDAARATPTGERKTLPAEMPKGYVPKAVEAAWCAAAALVHLWL